MAARKPSVLVAEDDPHLADQIRWALKDDYTVRIAGDRVKAIALLRRARPDLILIDLTLPPDNVSEEGFRILRASREASRETPVIVMSAVSEREAALRAVSEGAYDFFSKPVDLNAVRVVLARALERRALEIENRQLREQLRAHVGLRGIIGASPPMRRLFEAIERVKDSPVTVLVEGESGTGKELVARAIHANGARCAAPFVAVHAAALPETLLESELFGHERGAFTGALDTRVGRFEAAEGGTLFLDEVATLPGATQAKLLRVLQERTVERLGSNQPRKVDIRLVAASNENLEEKVGRGEFREDLFFRIAVFRIEIPPLRARVEDIPLLADHFLREACDRRGVPPKRFDAEALDALAARPWRGNVRELANVVERLALVVDGEVVRVADLPDARPGSVTLPGFERARSVGLKTTLDEFERKILVEAISRAKGVKARAAETLRLDPSQMKYLVKKHDL